MTHNRVECFRVVTRTLGQMIPALLLCASVAVASEPASWFSYRSDSVEIHVPNYVDKDRQLVPLSKFAVAAGRAYAKARGSQIEYLVIPVVVKVMPGRGLLAACYVEGSRKREFRPKETIWYGSQGLAVFEKRFRLKDVTGFIFVDGYTRYDLTLENKLK